jgi:hypothetical protein
MILQETKMLWACGQGLTPARYPVTLLGGGGNDDNENNNK